MQHFLMLKRNLLYTGVTRGKRLVILIGQKRALEVAVGAADQGRRWTKLAERLKV
jgi:exodeoxyribonuclease V alpha subunit